MLYFESGKMAKNRLLNISAVKESLKKHELRMSADFMDRLESEFETMLIRALARAKANGRKTVHIFDI